MSIPLPKLPDDFGETFDDLAPDFRRVFLRYQSCQQCPLARAELLKSLDIIRIIVADKGD